MRFFAHRELAMALLWRELVVRYKRSVLGIFWALAEPVFVVCVYVVVFGGFLGAGQKVESYPVFALFGVLPWLFFSSTLEESSSTLLEHALKGKGAMPPQGGGDFEDLEIGRAVVYLANAGGAKFTVPERPAAAAAGADGAAMPAQGAASGAATATDAAAPGAAAPVPAAPGTAPTAASTSSVPTTAATPAPAAGR